MIAFPVSKFLSFERFSSDQGLAAGEVRAVLQDIRGFMWFGMEKGLTRFDGFEFVRYENDPDNTDTISAGAVWCLEQDELGNLWVGTGAGLDYYDREKDHFRHHPVKLESEGDGGGGLVYCMHRDSDGILWLGTLGDSFYRFDPETKGFERFELPAAAVEGSRELKSIGAIARDAGGRLWIGTLGGGLFYGEGGDSFVRFPTGSEPEAEGRTLQNAIIRDLEADGDGVIVATDRGVWRVSVTESGSKLDMSFSLVCDPLIDVRTDSLMEDSDGNLWVGTNGKGIFIHDRKENALHHLLTSPYITSTISSDVVRRMFEDREGGIWLVHFPSGVSYCDRANAAFQTIRRSPVPGEGLSGASVTSFEEDSIGNLWIGTDDGGLNYWDRRSNQFSAETHGDGSGLSAREALAIALDQNETLWVGTWDGGLNRRDKGETVFRVYRPDQSDPESLSNLNVFSLLVDGGGSVWAGTMDGGLNRYDPEVDGFRAYLADGDNPGSLNGNQVWTLFEDRDGFVWAGTSSGLSRYDRNNDQFDTFRLSPESSDQPASEWISSIWQDDRGQFWIGTLGAGVFGFHPETGVSNQITEKDGLSSNMVCGILEDDSGQLWISTYDGLTCFNPSSRSCRSFRESSGLPGRQFNRFSAAYKTKRGELIFGAVEGLLVVNPSNLETSAMPPLVAVTKFSINNKAVRAGEEGAPLSADISETEMIELDWGRAVIGFQFAVLSFSGRENNVISYMLEGLDNGWREVGSEQAAYYVNMDPGEYNLKVRAVNSSGIQSEKELALKLVIVPPFWKAAWFKILIGLGLGVGVLAAGWHLASKRMRDAMHRAEQQRKLAEEREALQEKLRHSQKLEALGTLAGGVAHDFNNILSGISGYTEVLSEEQDLTPGGQEDLSEVQGLIRRASDLVKQILIFSRGDDTTFENLDLAAQVGQAIKLLKSTIPRSIRLVVRYPEDPAVIYGAGSQIQQIIINLGMNAAHAVGADEGSVMVSVNAGIAEEDARLPESIRGQAVVRIEVIDNGSGMTREVMDKIFDPFFTTKPRGKGTGLGLSVVFGIVSRHQGHIEVDSKPGEGTRFTLLFPRVCGDVPKEEGRELAPPPRGEGFRILVVDDEENLADLVRRSLDRHGYQVQGFSSSLKALAAFRSEPDRFDLVLADYNMPELSGVEMTKRMREIRPMFPLVLMSGADEKWMEIELGGLSIDARLEKPFSSDLLLRTVAVVCRKTRQNGRTGMSEESRKGESQIMMNPEAKDVLD